IAMEEPDWTAIPKPSDGLSAELEELIRKCIQKDPASRFASVQDLAQAIEGLEQRPPPPSSRARPQPDIDEKDFVLPLRAAPLIFVATQFGYMALYGAAMYHIDAVSRILATDFQI